ncbi:MAG: hypothetical protein IPM25_05415 [Chloracidobacterium sp.]|nr:hypothetical protein [Chloracidobacterium sp.]
MKEQLTVACFSILAAILAGCSGTEPNAAVETPNSNELKVAAEPTAAPTRTPLPPNVRRDADGNLIKPDGWPIQEIIPKETEKRTKTGKTRKGRDVIYNVTSITPEGRPEAEAILPYSEDGVPENFYVWRIRHVDELSGRDGKIFCYVYGATLFDRAHNIGVPTATSYHLCDYNGDGKYELKGEFFTFAIPDWVKSLPGDPAAIDNNANSPQDCGILCAK